jgi:hypothetical protein
MTFAPRINFSAPIGGESGALMRHIGDAVSQISSMG